MVTLGSDRAVREIHQVLNEEYFSRVRAGMSRDEVRQLLGKPGEIMMFGARDEEVWSWRYQQQNPMFFNVLFDRSAGTVRTTQRLEEILLMDQNC
jgi:outer membrane protein assembly factor BamE (lipoprotein component of BamABCDE complex)